MLQRKAVRDVTQDRGGPRDRVAVVDRRHGQGDGDKRAVLVDAFALEAPSDRTLAEGAPPDLDRFSTSVLGDDEVQRLSEDLLTGVSKEAFRRRVPAGD